MTNKNFLMFFMILVGLFSAWFFWRSGGKKDTSKEEVKVANQNKQNPNFFGAGVYTHPEFGFSFAYMPEVSIGRIEEGEGEVLLLQKKDSGTLGQIFIFPFPKDQKLSAELIASEFPEKKITNGKKVLIGGQEAFSFESIDQGMEKKWEVIFAKNEVIYQAMSLLENRVEFETILTSWEF